MSMQYQGHVSLGGTTVYCTGATANLARQPISPEIVWGGGWKVNYATGHFDPNFSLTFPWFQSYQSLLPQFWGNSRDNFINTAVLDNGGTSVNYSQLKCSTVSISADAPGSGEITCTANFSAKQATASNSSHSGQATTNVDGQTPVPAYKLTASANIQGVSISSNVITNFTVDVDNHTFKLFTLSGNEFISDLQQGLLTVTGSFTFYSAGLSIPTPKTGSFSCTGGGLNFNIPSLLVTGYNSDITGPNNKPMSVVRFEGFGTPSSPPMS